jgi:hypothetical protein
MEGQATLMPAPKLTLHSGGKLVSRGDLSVVATPPATKTHYPVPHIHVLDAVERALLSSGKCEVTAQQHALANDDQRYFGILQLRSTDADYADRALCVGVRNSHDKSFASEIVLGTRVFVCDNLSFSGEVRLARKHTRHIFGDLTRLAAKAVGTLGDHRIKQDLRINAYKAAEIDDRDCAHLLIGAMEAKAIPNQQISAVLEYWRRPTHEEFAPRTMWSLFNDFTEVYKASPLETVSKRSQILHGVFDAHLGLAV